MNQAEYQAIKERIGSAQSISFSQSFALAKQCGQLLGKVETETFGRDLVIRILEHLPKVDPNTKEMWNGLLPV